MWENSDVIKMSEALRLGASPECLSDPTGASILGNGDYQPRAGDIESILESHVRKGERCEPWGEHFFPPSLHHSSLAHGGLSFLEIR